MSGKVPPLPAYEALRVGVRVTDHGGTLYRVVELVRRPLSTLPGAQVVSRWRMRREDTGEVREVSPSAYEHAALSATVPRVRTRCAKPQPRIRKRNP